MKKSALVLYKNQPAIIIECGEKYTIEYPSSAKSGKATQSVRDKDIILLHEGPVSSISDLTSFAERAPSLFLESAITEIWALYETNDTIPFEEIAELLDNDFSANRAWGIFLLLRNSPYFSNEQGETTFTIRSEEEAAQIKLKDNEKARGAEVREEFLKRLKAKTIDLEQGDAKFMQEIEAFALRKSSQSKLLKEAGFSESEESAHKILIDTGFWHISKNPYPARWGLSTHSAALSLSHPPKEEREKAPCIAYAIDNAWSSDPDDAIAFDGEYLWVHIADPASTVLPNSDIDIAARGRGATLYIPEGASRMLCEESLEDYALGLTAISNALSFKIKLDENGNIDECEILKTHVEVERFTYEQVDSLKDDKRFSPLFAIAERNVERRRNNGAVFIDLPEVHITVNTDTIPPIVDIKEVSHGESSEMVREMMLLAGEAAARFAFKNNIPFMYVSQDTPDIPNELPAGLAGQYRLRRSMRARSVGVTPSNHAGLGIGMYSQVTSPLRRYGDLAVHQQLHAFLDGRELLDKDTLLEHIAAGDAAAGASVKAERKSNMHWTLIWLLQNPEHNVRGVVVDTKGNTATIMIPEIALETQMALSKTAEKNDEVILHASTIDIPKLSVTFKEI